MQLEQFARGHLRGQSDQGKIHSNISLAFRPAAHKDIFAEPIAGIHADTLMYLRYIGDPKRCPIPAPGMEEFFGYTEPFRRLVQPEPGIAQANQIPNNMPDWLPGEDYFVDFKLGDPYVKI